MKSARALPSATAKAEVSEGAPPPAPCPWRTKSADVCTGASLGPVHAVFWRDGKLLAVDKDLAGHELFAMDDSRAVIGRALLLDEGIVVVSLDNEVLIFRTPLGPLAEGPWPCGEPNLQGILC